MGQNSITLFTNDSGAAGGPTAYVQDAFQDITDTPSTNVGWSSTVSSNPMNNLYGNDDFPRLGPKTLWIKDLVLEPNRSLWVNGETTYRIIWSEPFPSAQGYVYGNVSLKRNQNQTFVQIRSAGDGLGVGGVFSRCMFLMVGTTQSSATAAVAVDGVANTVVPDWSSIGPSNPNADPQYAAYAAESANESYNIHDYRITANQPGSVFQIAGVIVYSENPSLTIDQFPGVTYNNKNRAASSANTTIPIPSFSSSLGGRSVIWKNSGGGYSLSAMGVSTILSIGQGSSGTNILNLTPGTGASFSVGYGIISASSAGASSYVGLITSISTDALTVSPTLPFGISNSTYRYFQSGQSLALNASLNIFAFSYGFTEMTRPGVTTPFFDPQMRYSVWGANYGTTTMDGYNPATVFNGASGFIQCEGYFSAAEIEWFGMSFSVLSGTMCVNGFPVYNHSNIGFTGTLKKSVFIEAGPGWNTFSFFPGSSHINVGVQRINLYQRNRDQSASYGILAQFDTLQAYAPRAVNATLVAPGTYQRLFADQLLLKGQSLTRIVGATWPGGVAYACGLSAALSFQYYGTNFAILGGMSLGAGASIQLSVDSGSNQGSTAINTIITASGGSMTFHSVSLSVLGGTLFISGLDFFRTQGEMKNLQTFSQVSLTNPLPVKVNRPPTFQDFKTQGVTTTYLTPYGVAYLRLKMAGGGGGGSGSGTTQNGGFDGTASLFGPHTASLGGGAASSNTPGIGGTATIGAGGVGLGLAGGNGGGGMENVTVNSCTLAGGDGGSNSFAGAGGGGVGGAAGGNAAANTGAGGGGAGCGVNATAFSGAGGGAGGYMDIVIPNPASSYILFCGSGGSGGNAGTNGATGGIGAGGRIFVEEWYG